MITERAKPTLNSGRGCRGCEHPSPPRCWERSTLPASAAASSAGSGGGHAPQHWSRPTAWWCGGSRAHCPAPAMTPALLGAARPQLGTGTSLELLPARAGHPDDPLIYWPVNHPCPSCFQPHSPKPLTLGAGLQAPTSPCSAGPGSLLPPSRQLGTTHCPALGKVSQPIPEPEMQREMPRRAAGAIAPQEQAGREEEEEAGLQPGEPDPGGWHWWEWRGWCARAALGGSRGAAR